MIYAIETDNRAVALIDDANAAERLNAGGKYGALTCRWASETERATFRRLALAATGRRQTGWLTRTLASWLWPLRVRG